MSVRIISIEGNIGTGKTTFLQTIRDHFKDREDVCFLDEPVDLWMNFKDKEGNILEHYYKDQKKYGFQFQMMAYISRLTILKRALENPKYKFIISERSLFTDKHIFCKMLYDDGIIEEIGNQIYNMWFDEFISFSCFIPVYLRTLPEVSFERVQVRSRQGETIPLEYLEKCHNYHEAWLKDAITLDASVSSNQTQEWIPLFEMLTL
jgi:deoxyadenosine/deoxycytidine kinase